MRRVRHRGIEGVSRPSVRFKSLMKYLHRRSAPNLLRAARVVLVRKMEAGLGPMAKAGGPRLALLVFFCSSFKSQFGHLTYFFSSPPGRY